MASSSASSGGSSADPLELRGERLPLIDGDRPPLLGNGTAGCCVMCSSAVDPFDDPLKRLISPVGLCTLGRLLCGSDECWSSILEGRRFAATRRQTGC